MAVAFRNSASVTNGTAGTSVVVSAPTGLATGDQLIAYIAATGIPSFTAPTGWTLVASAVDAGNTVTLKVYRKLAASEGASWTWTLGTSQRNWGWVGAYTGVDPGAPVTAFAVDTALDATNTQLDAVIFGGFKPAGRGIGGAAAVRTASGVATTWTTTSTERADVSTNAGAGTDISGVVGDSANPYASETVGYGPFLTASQTQTAGVVIALTLTPYFVPYSGAVTGTGIVVEAAFGVDPDSDSSTWTWTDLTKYVHDSEMPVVLTHGRANRTSIADPSRIEFTLLSLNGEFTNPAGPYAKFMVRNLPFRVRLNGFGVDVGGFGYHRGTAFLASARVRWDQTTNWCAVDIIAQGRLRRLQQRDDPLHSTAWYEIQRMSSNSGYVAPVAYWPFEDDSRASSAVQGAPDADVANVTFGADSTVIGSAPLAVFSATTTVRAAVPAYTDTGTWTAMFAAVVPAEPAASTTLLDTFTNGTAAGWTVGISPGSPSTMFLQVYDGGGASIFLRTSSLDEAAFYGTGAFYRLTVTQNGTGIDLQLLIYYRDAGGVVLGGGFIDSIAGRTAGSVVSFRVPPAAGLNGVAFGHLALHSAPGADGNFTGFVVVDGNAGDLPWSRFQSLCQRLAVPHTFDQSDLDFVNGLTMGPQGINTFIALVREAEDVEGCVVNDSGEFFGETGLLWFPARDDRENISASLTLDMAFDQLAPGFAPVLDDQDIVDDVEVTRSAGGTARIIDDASVATEGRYRGRVTLNLKDLSQLAHIAGWRLNLGTVRGMRFPTVNWNLRAKPALAQQWMGTRLFKRVDILHPPSQFPPDPIETILEGYTETISAETWNVQANLSPYRPNKVFVLAQPAGDNGTFVGRLDDDGASAVRAALTSTATSIPFDPNIYRWTAAADDFNPNLRVRIGFPGELVEVTSIATTAATFVAAGAMSSADNAAVTPALYAGNTANDWICVLARIRDASAGTLTTPAGYTRIAINGWDASSPMQLFVKVHSGSESSPTVTPTGGAAGDTVSAVTFGLRNMPITLTNLNNAVVDSGSLTNSSAQDIAYPGLTVARNRCLIDGCVVLLLGGKDDDWTSVATVSGFTEAVDSSTLTGNDQGLVVDYVIQTTATPVGHGSFTVTGGAAAVSGGAAVAFAGGFQTLTAIRSVNGVTMSQAAGAALQMEDDLVLSL